MPALQRNLFLEVLCEPQGVIHALVRVFLLLALELGSLEGAGGLAERHILHSFLEQAVILYKVKLTAF